MEEHGERLDRHDGWGTIANDDGFDEIDQMDQMMVDLDGHHPPEMDDEPTEYAHAFCRWLLVQMSWRMREPHTHVVLLLLGSLR